MIEPGNIYLGDCLELMRQMPDKSVDCCVTSPPYWGLRSYGVDGQYGLEPTPEAYVDRMVEVFREVRRVMKNEGTLWLNLGDSYAMSTKGSSGKGEKQVTNVGTLLADRHNQIPSGLKPKDLIGIPWRVAFALQQPYYAGRIKKEQDRIWLASMIDGEGCMFIHKRKEGQSNGQGYERKHDSFGAGLEVANTHESIIQRCMDITGQGSICRVERETQHKKRNIPLYRWNMRSNQCREIIREVYPYLVGKQHEARILLGCPPSGEIAERAHYSLMALHNGREATIDFPAPTSLYEQGFYLRQDIIWAKNNPMPESVTDRCTKSHEYIFLMTKSAKYWYDAEAIKEPLAYPNETRRPLGSKGAWEMDGREQRENGGGASYDGYPQSRNKRDVWTVATATCKEAHFATFPPKLIEPCILSGCPKGGIVLDCFSGAGTTAVVSIRHNRQFIGLELNPEYIAIAQRRIRDEQSQIKLDF